MNQTRVIVVPADNHMALSVIRSLGHSGYYVAAISTGNGIAHKSRYCSSVVFTAAENLADEVYNVATRMPGSFVICLGELEIISLNQRREQLESVATLLFPDSRRFSLALHKERTFAIAEKIGVPIPRTVDLDDDPDLLECRKLNFPVVIKPKSQDLLPFKAKYVDTIDDLVCELDGHPEEKNVLLVQERMPGYGVGIELLVKSGRTVLAFQHRRIRESPPSGGVSVCCESEPLNNDLLEYSERLLRAMDWEGVAMVEYKVDPATGSASLMEVNGRFWGSLPLAIYAGADFPSALVACNSSSPLPSTPPYRIGLRCRRLIGETKWLVTVISQRTVPFYRALAAYLWDFRPEVRYYIWTWDDPMPAIYALFKRARTMMLPGRG